MRPILAALAVAAPLLLGQSWSCGEPSPEEQALLVVGPDARWPGYPACPEGQELVVRTGPGEWLSRWSGPRLGPGDCVEVPAGMAASSIGTRCAGEGERPNHSAAWGTYTVQTATRVEMAREDVECDRRFRAGGAQIEEETP